jgi:LmbE family N-acetylglucosaminyl deacetylase
MNVLAIGAHFDDVEIGCAGSLAKHRRNGDSVCIMVVTDSCYDYHDGTVIRTRETALAEGKDAARILDCELVCFNYTTKHASFGPRLIEDIDRAIGERSVDCVYTHWDFDVHQDHQAIGKSTLAGARKVPRLLMYQSNLYTNTQPFTANYYVDITETIDIKRKAILAHKSEAIKFGPGWLDFWMHEAQNNGQKFGVQYAEAFQLVKWLS